MKIVVVESPAKAKTIEKYLGKHYKVLSSKGHIADLPKSELGVDVDSDFEPKYVITNKKTVQELKSAVEKSDGLVLAVDPDREGEAIGWHIARALKLIDKKGRKSKNATKDLERIVFTEITKSAILDAITKPRELDLNLVDAQQARRVLDRIVGYQLSPLLWKKIRFGLSAGRVQSVALRLIVDRENERNKFKSQEYWTVDMFTKQSKGGQAQKVYKLAEDDKKIATQGIKFSLTKINGQKAVISSQKEAEEIITKIYRGQHTVSKIESKEVKRSPYPPFTTSTLQQAAANRYGMSSKQTMSIAQKLYEAGHITYMRTDSLHFSQLAISEARKTISKEFGEKFLPEKPKFYANKSKSAQEAHEAIRPTKFDRSPAQIKFKKPEEHKIYDLIWKRAMASQMSDALLKSVTVIIEESNYTLQANGQSIIFPGFTKVYDLNISENILPEINIGDTLYPTTYLGEQHFTQPPARYSEASLIKMLESLGIGRPSTYAPIISTILGRKYVEKQNKYFIPTDTGIVVNNLLVEHFPDIVDFQFTAEIENKLDEVASGSKDWKKVLHEFYTPFSKQLSKKEVELKRADFTVLDKSEFKCPECGKAMNVKLGRYGRFLSCSNFPECKGMRAADGKTEAEIAAESQNEDFKAIYQSAPLTDDGREFALKTGKYGKFWAHPDYPKVKDARPLVLQPEVFRKIYGSTPKASDGTKMVLRRGRFGEFWAHPDYPEKKEIQRVNAKEVREKKKELGIE